MPSRVRTPASIRALLAANPKNGDLWATLTTIGKRGPRRSNPLNDRARIILATAILDQHLQTALLSHFPIIDTDSKNEMSELFEGDAAPLSSFSSRIRIAYALGIFGRRTKRDLERIKLIRNACAHSRLPVHFNDPAIADECAKLNALEHFRKKKLSPTGSIPRTAEQQFFAVIFHYFMCFVVEENEGELPTPLRYRLSPLGRLFS
jgi:DNA-binding MltR family transcriptional regulator